MLGMFLLYWHDETCSKAWERPAAHAPEFASDPHAASRERTPAKL
jgi:hypothetical protein